MHFHFIYLFSFSFHSFHFSWNPIYCKCSRSTGQRSRWRNGENRKIINNSAESCSISLKFTTLNTPHLTRNVPQTLKAKRLNLQLTAWHNVSTAIKRRKSGTNSLSEFTLGENYRKTW